MSWYIDSVSLYIEFGEMIIWKKRASRYTVFEEAHTRQRHHYGTEVVVKLLGG